VFEDDALIAKVNGALRGMWSRLESLSRDDELWAGANQRATRYKLEEFVARCVSRNPSDETARWASVGLSMQAGSFSGLHVLAEEAATREEAVSDLMAVAEWVWLQVGIDPGPDLEQALRRVGLPLLRRLAQTSGGPAAAGIAFLDGKSFAEAIGRRRWEMFLHALLIEEPDGNRPAVVDETLIADDERVLAAGRRCLCEDASAVVDLVDAARWWLVHRDVDVTQRLRDLLQAVPRRDLEQLAAGNPTDAIASSARTALLVLDSRGRASGPDP
jgi:hypothetical protein